jgi:two-component system, chemotaxis family, CheB/CheR fusion protein
MVHTTLGLDRDGRRAAARPPRPLESKGRQGDLRGTGSILVVDDDPDSADSLALLLNHWGHRVSVAYDGPRAIECYERDRPGLVLLDVALPGMNGYEVADWMNHHEHQALLIALTGYEELRGDSPSESGFAAHWIKPLDLGALRELLRRM